MSSSGIQLGCIEEDGLGLSENIFQAGPLQRIGVLELSSRACKLMVVDSVRIWTGFQSDSFYNHATLTHTGEHLQADNKIDIGMFRKKILPIITTYVEQAKFEYQVDRLYCIATAAYRKASNGIALLEVFQEIGLQIRVLSRYEEARATLDAFMWTASEAAQQPLLMIDQGGESTELVFKDGSGQICHIETIPLGTTTLIRRLLNDVTDSRPLSQTLEYVSRHYFSLLNAALDRMRPVMNGPFAVVGVGSAISAATGERANYLQHLKTINRGKIQKKVKRIKHQLFVSHQNLPNLATYFQNSQLKRKDKTREQLVHFVGLHMTNNLLKRLGASKLTISGFGLRYGICHQQLVQCPQFGDLPIPMDLVERQPRQNGLLEGEIHFAKVVNIHPKIGVFLRLNSQCDGLVPLFRCRQHKQNMAQIKKGQKLPVRIERIVFGPKVRIELSFWDRNGKRLPKSKQ